ncbi:formylglycine-generating enzyme [Gammaproteobacteria bacterium]
MLGTILVVGATVIEVCSSVKSAYDACKGTHNAYKTCKQVYHSYKTGKILLHGKAMIQVLKRFTASTQLQRVNDHFAYAANRDAISWRGAPKDLPILEPEESIIEDMTRPTREALRTWYGGVDQRLLGSSLVVLPKEISSLLTKNMYFLPHFLQYKPRFPDNPNNVGIIFKNAHGNDCISFSDRETLELLGLILHPEWKPNLRILSSDLICNPQEIQEILLGTPKKVDLIQVSSANPESLENKTPEHPVAPLEIPLSTIQKVEPLTLIRNEPVMVLIPEGFFRMGSLENEKWRYLNESPIHEVKINSFEIGKFAVTFEEWDACVADGGCHQIPKDENWGRGRRPVIHVSWNDVQWYIQWLNKKTGKNYRLLTEAEWEYAARAGTTTLFSYGQEISTEIANYNGSYQYEDDRKGKRREKTVSVDRFPPNPWGLHQMHGNIMEWTEDCWHKQYDGAPSDGSAWIAEGDCSHRVVRGGSWESYPRDLRSAHRNGFAKDTRTNSLGFRIARTPTLIEKF